MYKQTILSGLILGLLLAGAAFAASAPPDPPAGSQIDKPAAPQGDPPDKREAKVKEGEEKEYLVKGKVVAVAPERKEVTLDHEDIPGLMKAMQMRFKVEDAKVLAGIRAGDPVQGKLQVKSGTYTLVALTLNFQPRAEDEEAEIRAAIALHRLSLEDWCLAVDQGFCPIMTDCRLGSMGTPVKISLKGQPVFLCCPACKKQALAEPDQTLARVEKLKAVILKNLEHFCPMHPFIVRDDPRYKKCPICFMPFATRKAIPSKLSPEERVQQWKADMAWHRAEIVQAIRTNLSKLPPQDRLLAEGQGWCPVLEANPLGLMGPPFKITVKGQPVFLCCKDCETDAKNDPNQTLAKADKLKRLLKKHHDVEGKMVRITVTIEHEDIPGILKKGRMEFSVEGVKGLERLKAGDLVQGKLKLRDGDYNITELSAPQAGPPDKKDLKLKEFLKERLATLRALVKLATADYQAGKVSFDRLHQVMQGLLNAELEMCESDKERITVLEKAVALAKDFEKSALERYKSGAVTQSDVLIGTAARLEAEIALERAKTATPARPK